jgi:hypothetical protein
MIEELENLPTDDKDELSFPSYIEQDLSPEQEAELKRISDKTGALEVRSVEITHSFAPIMSEIYTNLKEKGMRAESLKRLNIALYHSGGPGIEEQERIEQDFKKLETEHLYQQKGEELE